MCIFLSELKRTITSFNIFFSVFNTNNVNLIEFTFIGIILNMFRWFLLSTYFLIFMQQDFIYCTVNNGIIILLPVQFISWYGIVPAVLSRSNFNIIRTKVSQDLALIWLMPGAMYETGFGLTYRVVYIYFSALDRDITHLGVSMWQGSLSSLFTDVTSTGRICPIILFTGRFYYALISIFYNTHAFKHVNRFIKINRLAVKNLQIRLLAPNIRHTI